MLTVCSFRHLGVLKTLNDSRHVWLSANTPEGMDLWQIRTIVEALLRGFVAYKTRHTPNKIRSVDPHFQGCLVGCKCALPSRKTTLGSGPIGDSPYQDQQARGRSFSDLEPWHVTSSSQEIVANDRLCLVSGPARKPTCFTKHDLRKYLCRIWCCP